MVYVKAGEEETLTIVVIIVKADMTFTFPLANATADYTKMP